MPEPTTDPSGRPIVEPDAAVPSTQKPSSPTDSDAGKKGNGGGDAAPVSSFREHTATVMAVLVIVALGVFYYYMLRNIAVAELQWERAMAILSGVEAIVFGAAGFLFGTQVQRQVSSAQVATEKSQTDEAKKNAKREQMRADREAAKAEAARDKATKGDMLATAVMAKVGKGAVPSAEYGDLGGKDRPTRTAVPELADLLALAEKVVG